MATDAARADTFPKLLIRNARRYAGGPAYRHKDLGIWQVWTWGEVLEEVRAYAAGLARLGLRRGDAMAIVGSNRPKLYWSVTAAQMLGAVPVPVYADAGADEVAFVLAHLTRFAAVEDQEQVDKFVLAERLPKLERIVYDERRAARLRPWPPPRHRRRHLDGRARSPRSPRLASGRPRNRGGQRLDRSIILYTSGNTGQSKGVVLSAIGCINAASDTVAFDQLTARDEALAYLPLAWVGDHYPNYAQALVAGFCIACPESPDTAMQDRREIGPTFFFAPPRVFEQMLTGVMIRMEDAGPLQRRLFHAFLGVARRYGEKILNRERVPIRAVCYTRSANSHLRPAQERARSSRTAYTGAKRSVPICFRLSLDRAQSEAALRPDRSLPLSNRAAGRKITPTPSSSHDQRRSAHRRERRVLSSRRACS